jgi:hypothetical protein
VGAGGSQQRCLGGATLWAPEAPCRKLTCEICGLVWLRDWRQVLDAAMDVHDGPHVSFVVTAPGADRLPWDESACAWRGPHRHDGKAGCRCSAVELAKWHAQAERNWTRLLQLVQQRVAREFGRRAPVIVRVWEPQERGAWHLHVVVSVKDSAGELLALRFGAHLRAEAGRLRFGDVLGFGLVDRSGRVNRKVYARGRSTGRYLAGYFVDDPTSRKASLLESVRTSSWTPRRVAWVSPKLTARSRVTMRVMRLSRRWWAARRRLCTYPDPTLYSPRELHTVWQLLGRVGGFKRQRHGRAAEKDASPSHGPA